MPRDRAVVGVISPGQMGAAIAGQARATGHRVLWDASGRSLRTRQRAEAAGLTACDGLGALTRDADVILSICPPPDAEAVAVAVASHDFSGIFVDANAISPGRFPGIAASLVGARAVLDGCIIGPPPGDDQETTLYLAGPDLETESVAAVFADSRVRTRILVSAPPAASGLKMAYAGYQKATRALAAVAHALARDYDVTEQLLDEAERNPRPPLADPDYLPSVAARAWRWAPELHDVARTLEEHGLPAEQAHAAARVLERWSTQKDRHDLTLTQALTDLRDHDQPRSP